jgi:hypothetical protein
MRTTLRSVSFPGYSYYEQGERSALSTASRSMRLKSCLSPHTMGGQSDSDVSQEAELHLSTDTRLHQGVAHVIRQQRSRLETSVLDFDRMRLET